MNSFKRILYRWRSYMMWKYLYSIYYPDFSWFYTFIRKAELSSGLKLTPSARVMILIPLEELMLKGKYIDREEVYSSLLTIFDFMKENPAELDRDEKEKRSVLSVIRAFWGKYCNIPPICPRVKEGEPKNGNR